MSDPEDIAKRYGLVAAPDDVAAKYGLAPADAAPAAPAQDPAAPPDPGALNAFGRGLGRGASLDTADEAGGFGAWLNAKLHPTEQTVGRGAGAPTMDPSLAASGSYTAERNQERQANAEAQAAHPIATGAGQLIGGAAPAIALNAAAPLAGVGNVARAAIQGGALGGVGGAGASEADTAGGVALDAAKGAGAGALVAGGVTAAAPYVAKGVKAAAGWAGDKLGRGAERLGEVATEQRLAGAGVERAGMRKLRAASGGLDRYAEGADRLGIGKQGILPESVRGHVEDAHAALDAASAAKDEIVGKLEEAGATVHGADVGAAIRKLKDGYGTAVGKHLEEVASEFDSMGETAWSKMNLERKDIGAGTAWDSGSVRAKLGKKIYGQINEAMADAAEKIEPGAGKAWRAANEDEHIALKFIEHGENKLNQGGNRAFSLTDYGAGAAGAAFGGPVGGLKAVVANKALRSVEHPIASMLASGGETALDAASGAAKRFGASSAGASPVAQQLGRAATGAVSESAATSFPHSSPAMAENDQGPPAQRSSDLATSDPKYGAMIAAKPPGHERDIVYRVALDTDPEFRGRERDRALREQQQQR